MIISKGISNFTALGRQVTHEGKQVNPEVAVSIASIHITEIDEVNSALNIKGKADGLKFGFSGYISSNDPLAGVFKKAKEEGIVLCVRFERKRKKGVDPTTPIADLTHSMDVARDNIVKIASGVYDFNKKKWVLSGEAESNPENDPSEVAIGIDQLTFDGDSLLTVNKEQPAPGNHPQYISKSKELEAKENALISMYFFLKEQEVKNNFTIDTAQRKKMAVTMIKLADSLQVKTFNLQKPAYSDYSHTRARFLIFKLAETTYPITEEVNSSEEWRKWATQVLQEGLDIWKWGGAFANKD